jgi:putative dimethyl sulfoxide reductase chaperone
MIAENVLHKEKQDRNGATMKARMKSTLKARNRDQGQFCSLMAALLSRPDAALLDDLQQMRLRSWLESFIQSWGLHKDLLKALLPGQDGSSLLLTLQEEYRRLFDGPEGKRTSLVESTYKPWTRDKSCAMVFAASKGLVLGDPALHMLHICEELSLEIPEEYRGTPDHLVLELELLALLYRCAPREMVHRFIEDHLDWIPDLKEELVKADSHPFYRKGVDLLCLFLKEEAKNMKDAGYGEKGIH